MCLSKAQKVGLDWTAVILRHVTSRLRKGLEGSVWQLRNALKHYQVPMHRGYGMSAACDRMWTTMGGPSVLGGPTEARLTFWNTVPLQLVHNGRWAASSN